jgi:hypothetical protein
MTAAPQLTYRGHWAGPLPGLAGWYMVPALGVHFRLDGRGESLRSEVWQRRDGTARAELWAQDVSGQELVWSQEYHRGDLGWAPYRDVMAAAAAYLAAQ